MHLTRSTPTTGTSPRRTRLTRSSGTAALLVSLVATLGVAGPAAAGPSAVATATPTTVAAATTTSGPTPPFDQLVASPDFTGDRLGDLFVVDADGRLHLYPGTGGGKLGTPRSYGTGWGSYKVYAPGDWNGDGIGDLVATDSRGRLFLYPGNGKLGFRARTQIGHGWNGYRIVPAGDVDNNGTADLLAIDSSHRLWLYPGDGRGGFRARKNVGHGWKGFDLYAAGDMNGDGRADILSIDARGRLWFYAGRGGGHFLQKKQVGHGWTGYGFASGADFDRNGIQDLMGLDPKGRLWFYSGRKAGTFAQKVQVSIRLGSSSSGSTAPTPAPKPSPTPSPAPTTPVERPGGKPGAHNTGVPTGTKLTVHQGDLTITKDNTVIDGLDVRGFITVRAKNVVIRNSIVRGRDTTSYKGLVVADTATGSVTIEDSELAPTKANPWIDGIRGWNITARRVNVHNVIDAVHVYGPNVTIEDSWLHDNAHFTNDPNWNGGPSHDDSIQIQVGNNIRIRNNNISGATGAAVQFTQSQGKVSDVHVVGNWIDGGACSINFAEKDRGAFTGIVIADNVFGRDTKHDNCAVIAPASTRDRLTLDANVYSPDGKPVSVRKG